MTTLTFFLIFLLITVVIITVFIFSKKNKRPSNKKTYTVNPIGTSYSDGKFVEILIENKTDSEQQVNLLSQDKTKNTNVVISGYNGDIYTYTFILNYLLSNVLKIKAIRIISDKLIDSNFLNTIQFCHSDIFENHQSQVLAPKKYLNKWMLSTKDETRFLDADECVAKNQKMIDIPNLKFNVDIGSSIDFKIQANSKITIIFSAGENGIPDNNFWFSEPIKNVIKSNDLD